MIYLAETVIYAKIKKFEVICKIIFIIISIIMFIFSLIYNEIIIIKLCSMEKYTAKYISIREKNEYENLNQPYGDNEDDELNNSATSIS